MAKLTNSITKYGPHPVDIHVGKRVRMRRILLGVSQEQLGNALGLTFQQVQKYESGANRISASRLYELGQILDVPVSFFFLDMSQKMNALNRGPASKKDQEDNPLHKRETLEFVRAYHRIQDPAICKNILGLTKAVAES